MPPKRKSTAMDEQKKKQSHWNWFQQGTLYYGYSSLTGNDKVASFDMDETLISTKSGAKFPKDADDWKFWHPDVPKIMNQLQNQGFKLVIYTNQKGIAVKKSTPQSIKKKIENIQKQMGVEITALIASDDDEYRKPGVKMWQIHDEKLNKGIIVDKKKSFFCGDAAGRNDGVHKDFTDTDLKFALNVGVDFKVPEVVFLGQKPKEIEIKGFNPKTIPIQGSIVQGLKDNDIKFVEKQMIIFVGAPGAGKSTFWKNYLPEYVRVNRDTLKTKQKCYKVAEEQIKKGKSVVIDNTNPTAQDRRYFIDLAKNYKYKVRCFRFLTNKDICFHNDYQRVVNNKREHLSGKAGSIPIHTWFKKMEEPTLAQGFYQINKVNFIAKFNDEADKEAYQSFSKK